MAKRTVKSVALAIQNDREMRDRMNGVIRDENGKMIGINGKLFEKKEPENNLK